MAITGFDMLAARKPQESLEVPFGHSAGNTGVDNVVLPRDRRLMGNSNIVVLILNRLDLSGLDS